MQSGQHRLLRRIGRLLLWSLGGLLLLLGVAFAYAQTPIAKDQLARALADSLSEPPNRTQISGLRGFLPFEVRVGRISLADEEGEWLRVEEAALELAPGDLMAGRLRATRLGAERVALSRLPDPDEAPSSTGLPSLPAFPERLPPVTIDRLYVTTIELGPAVLGEEARFDLRGSLRTDAGGSALEAELALRRTDREGTEAALDAALDLEGGTLTLDVRASDDGRLLGALLGRPETGPVSLGFAGRGPFDDFSATLDLTAENLARLEAEFTLARGDTLRLLLDGRFRPAPGVLPPDWAALVGDSTTVAFELVRETETRIALPRLALDSGFLLLDGRGALDLADNRIEGEVTARIADLARASALLGGDPGGSLALTARPRPGGGMPAVELEIDGRDLRYEGFEAAVLDGSVTLEPLAPLDRPFAGLAAEGRVGLRGLARNGASLDALRELAARFSGRWRRGGAIEIAALDLDAPALTLRGQGTLDPMAGEGRLAFSGRTEDPGALAALAAPADRALAALAGRVDLALDLTLAEAFESADGDLVVTAAGLGGLPGGVDPLVGPSPRLQARLAMRPGGIYRLDAVDLAARALRLTGEAGMEGPERRLAGTFLVELPDLAPLAPLLGQEIVGGGRATVTLGGSLGDPAADAELRLAPFAVAGYRLDALRVDARAAGLLRGPEGELRAEAELEGQRMTLAGRYALRDARLRLREATLEGPESTGSLDLVLDLDGRLAQGEIALSARDLAALAPWHRQELAGALDLTLRLDRRDGIQNAKLEVSARDLGSPYGDLRGLSLEAAGTDLYGAPSLTGTLRIEGLQRPDVLVEAGTLRFSGPLGDLALSADAAGSAGDPFDLAAEARLALAGTRQELTLTALEGRLAGERVRLRTPAKAVLEKGVLAIDRLDLFVGRGTIRGDLETDGTYRKARLTGSDLPLALLGRFAEVPMRGSLAFDLDLDLGRGSPRARLEARVESFHALDLLGVDYRPVDLALALLLENGRLEAALETRGDDPRPSRAELRIPFAGADPTALLSLPPDTPVEGRLDARAELALVTALLGLRDQYVTGRAEAELRLSGTLAAPRLDGALRVVDGRVEDGVSGAVLRDIRADVRAEGDRLRIARFEARDPRKGRVELAGELRFADPRAITYALDLEARGLLFWNTPLATLAGDADLRLEGDLERARLAGRMVLGRGEIRVLARTSATIPEIEVVEVGNGRIVPPDPRPREEASPAFPLEVAVRVEVPGRLFARGGGLDSEWSGALRVSGVVPAVAVVGDIEARRAVLDLLGRRFRLRQGRILFSGSVPPDPRIELVAEAETADLTALFHITGPLSEPSLLLESEPPLPRDEVVARLLFDEDAGRLEPLQALQVATILAEMEGGGLDVLGELRDLTTLDTLRISGGRQDAGRANGGEAAPPDSYVAAGKYLTEEVYVEVEQSVRSGETTVRAEVDLGAGVKVNSVIDGTGGGVELEWRYDF